VNGYKSTYPLNLPNEDHLGEGNMDKE
jgi:hypothetical protein